MRKPNLNEIPEYYHQYVNLVPDGDFSKLMTKNVNQLRDTLDKNTKGSNYAYADGKWTILEIVSHLIDVERVMMNRVHAFVRGEKNAILGFDHDAYVADADLSNKSVSGLFEEFELIRAANLAMFRNFSDEEWERTGTANNVQFTVRGLAYIMMGHVIHHLNVIEEKYYD
jgi:hypothetical protein